MEFNILENTRSNLKSHITSQMTSNLSPLSYEVAERVNAFHCSFPMYEVTPLCELKDLASYLGLENIYVKDESFRFGLNAFKVLGASYAIASLLAQKVAMNMEDLSYERLISKEMKNQIGPMFFVSATDGNHGRGVAWAAKQLGQEAMIFMPKGSAKERVEKIRFEGAKVEVTEGNYDESVRIAHQYAMDQGGILIQDTSWEGYEKVPLAIIQGYMTMAYEVLQQLDGVRPSHVFLQAGVGSFATAMTGFFVNVYGENRPKIIIVEPKEAACIYKTMEKKDGKIHRVEGEMKTIMAGLACGEPVSIGIDILRDYVDYFVSCPDYTAAQGMRVLSSPAGKDERIISGESGAVGVGLCYEIMTNERLQEWKEKLELDAHS
ncbi:MAG: diaminopropionate ammonia-lyase, partial [Vallitaleaceae bacterium]|nr:diaminopropionate ammonia-lyase [Vallitaleaceae bacterium]